jgi:hypothetical protein
MAGGGTECMYDGFLPADAIKVDSQKCEGAEDA